VLTEEDRELALAGAALLRSGLDRERFLELICVMSNLLRAGDWYGRPVNLAARLTEFARRGSVVASADVHDAAADGVCRAAPPEGRERRDRGLPGASPGGYRFQPKYTSARVSRSPANVSTSVLRKRVPSVRSAS
jgi:hypothetical protein